MSELAEFLQSVPSHELTKKIASEISERSLPRNPRRIVIEEFISLTREFMSEFFVEIRPDLEKHAYNYPFMRLRIPGIVYDSTDGRISYGAIQDFLRKIPWVRKGYYPKPVDDPVIPIILPGVDYSAESLLSSSSLRSGKLPDKSKLGWQHLDTYADYCMGLMALGRETYASLLDAWYSGNDTDLYFQSLETIAEEMLHHISDKIAGPRYTELSIQREHYWMKSYGEFPEKVDIALLRLKDDYLGGLNARLSQRLAGAGVEKIARQKVLKLGEIVQ